jgi:hypothetical protein
MTFQKIVKCLAYAFLAYFICGMIAQWRDLPIFSSWPADPEAFRMQCGLLKYTPASEMTQRDMDEWNHCKAVAPFHYN